MIVAARARPSMWRFVWFRLLTLADAAGLALVLGWVIHANVPFPEGRPFVIVLVAATLLAWRVLLPRSPFPRDTLFSAALATPLLASALTVLVMASLREYYSGNVLLQFTLAATTWMALGRALIGRLGPKPTLLLVGDARYLSDLEHEQSARVESVRRPPATLQGWDGVIIEPHTDIGEAWLGWLAAADAAGVQIMSGRSIVEQATGRVDVELLEGRWAAEALAGATAQVRLKRVIDVASVVLAAPLILFLVAAVALVVRIDSGRPILFWQERIGFRGKPFRMVKFRTMRPNAESGGARFADTDDARITKAGALLRRYRLDELPQFWNVLRGDMSIIGPRPEQSTFADSFERSIPLYELRHNVRPGITGWAQVHQGYAAGDASTKTKLSYDLYYVKHMSVQLDVRIVAKTIATILTGFGAR